MNCLLLDALIIKKEEIIFQGEMKITRMVYPKRSNSEN